MRARRVDANHAEVITALRRAGCRVWDTSRVGGGFPDALVAARGNRLVMLEIKDGAKSPSRRKLTPAEADFHRDWSEHVAIVETVEQALAAVGVV
jgi:hypothetical protein